MDKLRRHMLIGGAIAGAGFGVNVFAAPEYPVRPVKVIIPYPPGGPTDIVGRIVCTQLSEIFKQPFSIENKPGASGMIGADMVAKAAPDGYTLYLTTITTAINPWIYEGLPYDFKKDMKNIVLLGVADNVFAVTPKAGINNAKDLIAFAKKNPGQMSYGSSGIGTIHNLLMELIADQNNVQLNHIPYKGAAPALQDVVGGQVPMMFVDTASGYQFITSGKLRPIGIASAKRVKNFENIPTLAEQGLKNFEAYAWQGLLAPAGTPEEVIHTLNKALMNAMNTTQIKAKLQVLGLEATPSTPQAMAEYAAKERAKWGPIIKANNIKAD
mgnify:CR=1 FL=1